MELTEEQLKAQELEKAKAEADAKTKEDQRVQELLKTLKLSETEMESLKGSKNILDALEHNLEAKRGANKEAKEYREKLEALEKAKDEAEKAQLEKKGEYESLYKEANEKLTAKDAKIKQALISGKLDGLAGKYGLVKTDYLKLIDTSVIDVDIDKVSVTGAEEVFKKFMEESPELFDSKKIPNTDSNQPSFKGSNLSDNDKLKELEKVAAKSGMPRDLARYKALKRELENKK